MSPHPTHRVAAIALLVLLFATLDAAPFPVIVAAVVPAILYAALLAALLRPREPPALLATLFLWGAAAAAPLAEAFNDRVAALPLGPAVLGPAAEETVKALGLVALAVAGGGQLRTARSGIACGASIGLGFAAVENLGYHLLSAVQGGPAGLARAVFVRGILQGLNHATFSAFAGAGLGFARSARTSAATTAPVLLGFAVAIAHHVVWNAVASRAITDLLCGAPDPGGACLPVPPSEALYLRVPLLVALFIGPGVAALAWLARPPAGPAGESPAR